MGVGGGVRGGEAGQLGLFCGDLKSWLRSPRSLPGRCESFKDWKPSCLRKGRVRDSGIWVLVGHQLCRGQLLGAHSTPSPSPCFCFYSFLFLTHSQARVPLL